MTPHQVRRTRLTAGWVGACVVFLAAFACIAIVVLDASFLVARQGTGDAGLPAGSLAITVPVDGDSIQPGDVVTARDDHRERVGSTVVSAQAQGDETLLLLQGDDAPRVVRTAERVEASLPYVGYAVAAAASPTGVVLLGALLVVLGLLTPAVPEVRGGRHRSRRRLALASSSDRAALD